MIANEQKINEHINLKCRYNATSQPQIRGSINSLFLMCIFDLVQLNHIFKVMQLGIRGYHIRSTNVTNSRCCVNMNR